MLWLWILVMAAAVILAVFLVLAVLRQDFAVRRTPRFVKLPQGGNNPARAEMRRQGLAYLEGRPHEEWTITAADGTRLQAGFWPADAPTGKTVLAVHGHRCSGKLEYGMFAPFYHALGFNVLLPDDRAHGESGGTWIGFGWLDKDDCLAWAAEAARRIPGCRVLLHGISMGAATVLMAAGQDACPPCVEAVAADCAYSSAWEQFALQVKNMLHLPPFPVLYLASLVNRLLAGYWFRQPDTAAWAARIRVPVLLIHGTADTYVPTAMVYKLYDACTCEKSLWLAEGAPHAASWTVQPQGYQDTLRAFLSRAGLL